jgi:hypothetical protein
MELGQHLSSWRVSACCPTLEDAISNRYQSVAPKRALQAPAAKNQTTCALGFPLERKQKLSLSLLHPSTSSYISSYISLSAFNFRVVENEQDTCLCGSIRLANYCFSIDSKLRAPHRAIICWVWGYY